ncbi:Filamentation induced by cAMP protein fic (plasmid) [Sinomonas atrocyanea]|uniref:Filamentation induced by cAMP protein fic n=1 Tax=Sinomonas atrocyanea TaxID=37927 RepID=A0A127A5N2_9MICC|nr:Fic family protein [Sinomonas atrocyanea]AMM34798.1 Filamentation induced by cAMP protein fic [Sinomonas atrocyanea]GEB64625.1 Fic family protein [Sinomonas atrocyanea]
MTVQEVPAAAWPPVVDEPLEWTSRHEFGPRAALGERTARYRAAVPALIGTASYAPSGRLAAELEDAAVAVREFDAELGSGLAPFASVLLRTESVSSSMIENVSASARSVAMAELGDTSKRNATLVVDNVAAMRAALAAADDTTPESILAMHRALMAHADPAQAGRWREEPVWIGTSASSPVGADYVAPRFERVPGLIEDLAEFVRRNDIQVLAHAMLAHAQFETIHPFTDGNGRTGRALLQAILRGKGLTRNVTVPISAGLLVDVRAYHRALDAYREGQPDEIVRMGAAAAFRAIENGRRLAADIAQAREGWNGKVTARGDNAVWKVMDLLERQPVVTSRVLEEELGLSATTAWRAMGLLEEAGVVVGVNKHRMGRNWRSEEVLRALDEFAQRAGRRGRAD